MPDDTQLGQASIDPIALRRAFGTFVTGITVLTTRDADGQCRGMTANSFTSVSLDPPLLLVCVGKSAHSYAVFRSSASFAVNVLHESQTEVSRLFASKSPDKFDRVSHDKVHTGAPILTDCLTWFDCTVHSCVDAGDHAILIGQVRAFGTTTAPPLAFCRGQYATVANPLPAGWLSSHSMIVAYLIEASGRLLLQPDGKGGWALPCAAGRAVGDELKLPGGTSLALVPDDTFLYSVFDIADSDPGYLIYRARLSADSIQAALDAGLRFFPLDALPYDGVPAREIKAMLRRYARESEKNQFGIYMDTSDGGRLAMVDRAKPWTNTPPGRDR